MEKTEFLNKNTTVWFKRKGFLFTLAYSLAIFAWFGYATINGTAMLAFSKATPWHAAKGAYHSTQHHK